jgi:hypothetical protein
MTGNFLPVINWNKQFYANPFINLWCHYCKHTDEHEIWGEALILMRCELCVNACTRKKKTLPMSGAKACSSFKGHNPTLWDDFQIVIAITKLNTFFRLLEFIHSCLYIKKLFMFNTYKCGLTSDCNISVRCRQPPAFILQFWSQSSSSVTRLVCFSPQQKLVWVFYCFRFAEKC